MLSIFLRFFIVFIFCIAGTITSAQQSEIIYEKTYLLKSQGIETGYVKVSQRKKVDDSIPVIVTKKHIEQNFKRLNEEIKLTQEQVFIEDETGKPVKFQFKSKNQSEEVQINGKFYWNKNQILIYSLINDVQESKAIPVNENIIFPYAIDKLHRETKADSFTYYTIEPGIDLQELKIDVNKVGQELIQDGNLDGMYTKYKVGVNIFPNTEILIWKNKNGHTVKEYTSLLNMEQISVDKDEILDIPAKFDIFSESFIKVEKDIPTPDKVSHALYKITIKDSNVNDLFPEDENQRVIQVKDNTVFLKVEAENYDGHKFPYPVNTEGYENYLRTGPFIITDSEKIQDLALKLKSGEDDAFKIAQKMKKWVYKRITNKNLAFDFANAVKVLETKTGDCTEHSVLLASLLRAAGIPAKINVGLVYTDHPENAFVYHMWVKAYVGRWISLDPSQPYENFTPVHINMAESELNNITAKSDMLLNIINSFSKMNIEVLNISKPVIKETTDRPEVNINLNNKSFIAGNNYVSVKITKFRPVQAKIQEINFPQTEKKDNIKEAFYNFTKGETVKALQELKEFYKNIDPKDNFMKMKLALKLINMSYFNFAEEVLDKVGDRDIWGSYIDELYILYFPKNLLPESREKFRYTAFYALNYKNDPDLVLEITKDIINHDYIYFLRAKAFAEKNVYQNAEFEINNALRINPENLTYNLEKIKILSSRNKTYEAQKVINQVNLIVKKYDVKNKEFMKKYKSYDYWLKVKQFRENKTLSKYYEAYYYLIKGEIETALDILNKLVDISSQSYGQTQNEPYINILIAEAFYEIDQFESAEKYYQKALYQDKNNIKANLGMGNINFLYDRHSRAEEFYKNILKTRPNNVDALLALAKLHTYQGNTQIAFEYFKQILVNDKGNPDVLYNIGVILANRQKYEKAEKLLKKVLSVNPMDHHQVWLDLAKVQLAQGNYSEAVKSLKNVNYLDENNPYYYYYMSILLKKNNNREDATKYLRKALDLKPSLINELK